MTTAHRAYLCCMAATMLILVPLLASTLARAEIPRSASDLARDGTSKQNATMALIGVRWRSLAFVGVRWRIGKYSTYARQH